MSPRGQGTVELALGATLLVTVVMLGVYLSELSFLSLKVQEASAAAIWDASGRPVHDYTRQGSTSAVGADFGPSLARAASRKSNDYADYDALGGGSGTRRLFAAGQPISVQCDRADGVVAFNLPPTTGGVRAAVNGLMRNWYQPQGGAICTAAADVLPYELPANFYDRENGGFFSKFREERAIRLCGVGRAVDGACGPGYAVLLGDWGMDRVRRNNRGNHIVRDSRLPESPSVEVTEGNLHYRSMVRRLFIESGRSYGARARPQTPAPTGAAATFARRMTGTNISKFQSGERVQVPADERAFYMSFSGVEHGYGDMLEPDDPINKAGCKVCHFNTAGTSSVQGNPLDTVLIRPPEESTPEQRQEARRQNWSYLRAPCFLGISGNGCAGQRN